MPEVIALVGSSGTGKSHLALELARKEKIDAIIDDGLLIYSGKIVAGISAKSEANVIAATRRAVFIDTLHAQSVREGIERIAAKRILVLGTSARMVDKICFSLSLPSPERTIAIEDVSNKETMATARHMRKKEGKHVIPVPSIEVKKGFAGSWRGSIENIFGGLVRRIGHEQEVEKTIVRPRFSYIGTLEISETVVAMIARTEAGAIKGCLKVNIEYVRMADEGIGIGLEITVAYGAMVKQLAGALREAVAEAIEYKTGLFVREIDLYIKNATSEKQVK